MEAAVMNINEFVKLMTGHFDNKEQFEAMKKAKRIYPYAQHVNTVCNDKIKNLPGDFKGIFIVEESYYENDGKSHASPHLFLITEKNEGILLSSYEIPEGEDKNTFSYETMKTVDYNILKKSEKFKPRHLNRRTGDSFFNSFFIYSFHVIILIKNAYNIKVRYI